METRLVSHSWEDFAFIFWDEVGALKAYKNLLEGKVCDFTCHLE